MILSQSYLIITDGFCVYLSNPSLITRSLGRNLDLRDASLSKKFARHLKKICKRFVKDLKYTHLMVLVLVLMVLVLVLKVLTAPALILMILSQSYLISTDEF